MIATVESIHEFTYNAAHPTAELCACKGHGWFLSDWDTWTSCPAHPGHPHPETPSETELACLELEGAGDAFAHEATRDTAVRLYRAARYLAKLIADMDADAFEASCRWNLQGTPDPDFRDWARTAQRFADNSFRI